MKQRKRPMSRILVLASVCALTACSGISPPVSVDGLRQTVGDSLPGARGQTEADQTKIDRTVARLCAAGIYAGALCDVHTDASRDRRAELIGAVQ